MRGQQVKEATAERLGAAATLRPAGECVLHGKAAPVPAFELVALAAGGDATDA